MNRKGYIFCGFSDSSCYGVQFRNEGDLLENQRRSEIHRCCEQHAVKASLLELERGHQKLQSEGEEVHPGSGELVARGDR